MEIQEFIFDVDDLNLLAYASAKTRSDALQVLKSMLGIFTGKCLEATRITISKLEKITDSQYDEYNFGDLAELLE